MPHGEARAAVGAAAALYVVGAGLIATSFLLPHVRSPAGAAGVAAAALLTAVALILEVLRDRVGLLLAFVADLWGVACVGVLCWSTGGTASPFALIYFFAIGHAAAFQPRGRFLFVSLAGLAAFLAPLAYEHVPATFGVVASVGAVLALLTTGAIHVALERMRHQRRRLEFLIAATAKLDTSLDPEQALRRIAGTALPELAALCVIDIVDAAGSITTTVAAAVDGDLAAEVERLHRNEPPDMQPGHPIAVVLSTRAPCVVQEPRGAAAAEKQSPPAGGETYQVLIREAGFRAIAVFPMVARGRLLGTMAFLRPRRFGNGHLALLEDLTGRASLAFDNARLYAERAHVAHTLRRSLMPAALPAVAGLQLESFFQPMGSGSEVGGDFYDVFGDGANTWLVVGDVCGKGAEAAVLTGFLRHTTVAYAREGDSPAAVLARVNDAMLQHDLEGRFATAILAHLGFGSGEVVVTLAAAGHPAALISRSGGAAEELGAFGTLLGVYPDPNILDCSAVLRPGDALALYTDGLAEAHAPQHVLSVDRMLERLAHARPRSAREAIDALVGLVDLQSGVRDDIAILAAHVAAGQHGEGTTAGRQGRAAS
jgi:serine phosphatase RsbU (regulator of sigma subunit)